MIFRGGDCQALKTEGIWISIGISWNYPPPSNSHHQDYFIFSRESQPKPSFVTVTGWGVNQRDIKGCPFKFNDVSKSSSICEAPPSDAEISSETSWGSKHVKIGLLGCPRKLVNG